MQATVRSRKSLMNIVLNGLFFFSPLLLLILPNGISGWPLVGVGEVMLTCRLIEALLDTRGKMIFAGLGVVCFLVFFPCYFLQQRKGSPDEWLHT